MRQWLQILAALLVIACLSGAQALSAECALHCARCCTAHSAAAGANARPMEPTAQSLQHYLAAPPCNTGLCHLEPALISPTHPLSDELSTRLHRAMIIVPLLWPPAIELLDVPNQARSRPPLAELRLATFTALRV